jgi:hypothetical protein
MPISAIFANAHFLKKHFCAVFRALGHQGHGRHGRLLCLQTWVKGYMTEFGLVATLDFTIHNDITGVVKGKT